ncbi:hypothetical protein PIB30_071781 [Stylosanthes scabra]|uniref:Uncharacterized protein n=1 Tax=Stylosanthes scabra TaxID=79078 RepID=A0ABU6RNU5_9FABA|nr:hypothetical protein [Stylosanthes scabra]
MVIEVTPIHIMKPTTKRPRESRMKPPHVTIPEDEEKEPSVYSLNHPSVIGSQPINCKEIAGSDKGNGLGSPILNVSAPFKISLQPILKVLIEEISLESTVETASPNAADGRAIA